MNVYDRPVVKLFLKYGFQVVDVKEGDIVSEQAAQQKEKPNYQVGERSIKEIIADLSKPIPASVLKTKKVGGQEITYIAWHTAIKFMEAYAPGFCYEIRNVQQTADNVIITARITIRASDGEFYREATGIEGVDVNGWGDAASNASSMALRRACAMFGLGLYLYNK